MRPRAVTRHEAAPAVLEGRVLCHDVRDASGEVAVAKGAVLGPAHVAALLAAPWDELHCLELEPGELPQEPAGRRLAVAAAGDGVALLGPSAGQWPLAAVRRGLLTVDIGALEAVNVQDGAAVFTLHDGQVVDAGEVVARATVTRLAVREPLVAAACARAREAGGLVRVLPFRPCRIGAVSDESPGEAERAAFEAALGEKAAWLGSDLLELRVARGAAGIAEALRRLADAGADLLVVAGASAMDPLDPIYTALGRLEARVVRLGVPAHPGTHLWLALLGAVPVVGVPTCRAFRRATVLDIVLPRLLADLPLAPTDLAALGHGGLLSRDLAFRLPRYRAASARGSLE